MGERGEGWWSGRRDLMTSQRIQLRIVRTKKHARRRGPEEKGHPWFLKPHLNDTKTQRDISRRPWSGHFCFSKGIREGSSGETPDLPKRPSPVTDLPSETYHYTFIIVVSVSPIKPHQPLF